jgi:hypothetical protein
LCTNGNICSKLSKPAKSIIESKCEEVSSDIEAAEEENQIVVELILGMKFSIDLLLEFHLSIYE